jgi:peptidoglycan biosynthesis protein MviN/MurJ (putative lipid II flippase)
MIGLPINVIRDTVYRYFYAKGNTNATFKNSISASIVNIIVSILLSKVIGIYGVVLGTVITSVFSLTSILIRFRKQYGFIPNKNHIIVENAKIIISSIMTIALSMTIKNIIVISNPISSILFYASLVVIFYSLSLFIFKSKIHKIKL